MYADNCIQIDTQIHPWPSWNLFCNLSFLCWFNGVSQVDFLKSRSTFIVIYFVVFVIYLISLWTWQNTLQKLRKTSQVLYLTPTFKALVWLTGRTGGQCLTETGMRYLYTGMKSYFATCTVQLECDAILAFNVCSNYLLVCDATTAQVILLVCLLLSRQYRSTVKVIGGRGHMVNTAGACFQEVRGSRSPGIFSTMGSLN